MLDSSNAHAVVPLQDERIGGVIVYPHPTVLWYLCLLGLEVLLLLLLLVLLVFVLLLLVLLLLVVLLLLLQLLLLIHMRR